MKMTGYEKYCTQYGERGQKSLQWQGERHASLNLQPCHLATGAAPVKSEENSVTVSFTGTVHQSTSLMSLPVPIITAPSGCRATRVALERVLALTPATVKTFGAVLRISQTSDSCLKYLVNTYLGPKAYLGNNIYMPLSSALKSGQLSRRICKNTDFFNDFCILQYHTSD